MKTAIAASEPPKRRVRIDSLWECRELDGIHAPGCTCDYWHNGRSNPESIARYARVNGVN